MLNNSDKKINNIVKNLFMKISHLKNYFIKYYYVNLKNKYLRLIADKLKKQDPITE